jgi:4'-phosphopantetheinyl transferase
VPEFREAAAWALRLDLEPAALALLSTVLSPDEHARADRYRRPADRARFIAGRAQVRQVLGRFLDTGPAEIRFARSPTGKPTLATGEDATPLHFNVSGSEGLALIALRQGAEVGVDVEAIRAMPETDALAARMLSKDEQAQYSRLPPADRERRFFEYWVCKEALAKSLGTGLREGFDRLSLHPWPSGGTFRLDVPRDRGWVSQWVAPLSLPEPGYVGAIASSRPLGAIDVRWWDPPELG